MSAASIFGKDAIERWFCFRAELEFTGPVIGGIPSDPSVIRKWLTSRLDLGDAALEELIVETIKDREVLSVNEKVDAIMASGESVSVNGFKRDENGVLCMEGRQIKAGLKEAMNVCFPGTAFPGKPKDIRKGLMRYAAERVFVPELFIPLGVKEPTRVEERVKHVQTPQGPRSAINRVELVEGASIAFHVMSHDELDMKIWGQVWSVLEHIGLGSDRARGDGTFELKVWDSVKVVDLNL